MLHFTHRGHRSKILKIYQCLKILAFNGDYARPLIIAFQKQKFKHILKLQTWIINLPFNPPCCCKWATVH